MALLALQNPVSESTPNQSPRGLAVHFNTFECKLLSHRISVGFPSAAAGYAEEGLDFNHYLVENKPATFMFTVKGNSMMGAGICDVDKVAVDEALKPGHKDIVVAIVDGEYTIKRLYHLRGRIELPPKNTSYDPITFNEGSELQIWGVVVGLVRKCSHSSGWNEKSS